MLLTPAIRQGRPPLPVWVAESASGTSLLGRGLIQQDGADVSHYPPSSQGGEEAEDEDGEEQDSGSDAD